MWRNCPYCAKTNENLNSRPDIISIGSFYRKSDSQRIQRYRCLDCNRSFSSATSHPCVNQNKRQFNETLRRLLCSGVSQRRAAKILNLSRTTIVRKFLFLAKRAEELFDDEKVEYPKSQAIEFDDMETFEHSKCKPLSITLAVEHKTRRILGFEVSQMPAKGKLASISRKKYGIREDHRPFARAKLFKSIKHLVADDARIKSDENPHYPNDVRRLFPNATHETHKGKRGCIVGQGELKKIGFDPLFSLNHTCAKLRADINRLFRRTWCTTKKPDRLWAHIMIYVIYHNRSLKR